MINVIIFSHRSDTYVHVLLLFIELHSIPPRDLFILCSKLNLFIINAYEMFPVFFSLQQLKTIHAKTAKAESD